MSHVVVDASVIGALILEDERDQLLSGLVDVLSVQGEGALVPTHWILESASMVQSAWRRKRLTETGVAKALALLRNLFVQVDQETDAHALDTTWRLSQRHGLTIYDAAYLELAIRRASPLASADVALLSAARKEQIGLFGR